jgi:hypothetical protein
MKYRVCDECGGVPRRLAMEMEGKLFCRRDCYLAYCARKWDQVFTETFGHKPVSKVLELHKPVRQVSAAAR